MLSLLLLSLLAISIRGEIFTAPSLPLFLPDTLYVTSTIVVGSTQTIGDIKVFLSTNHTYTGDIVMTLRHVETGTAVLLMGFVHYQRLCLFNLDNRTGVLQMEPMYCFLILHLQHLNAFLQ